MKPDFAFYYPGQYWLNVDWAKNLVCFFDGIAMLIPEHMPDYFRSDDDPIVSSLKDEKLFHVIRPEKVVDKQATEALAEAFNEIIASGRLDRLINNQNFSQADFSSLSMSRLGYSGDQELADSIFQSLKSRGLADDSKDDITIPMHRTVRSLILVLLAHILKSKGEDMGITLSPATDQGRLINALGEVLKSESSPPASGDIVSFDMAKQWGLTSVRVPIDEILDFRQQHYRQHRELYPIGPRFCPRTQPYAARRTRSEI